MSRTRQLSDLILDVRKRADVENKTARHPDADIIEYINQSIADLYDQLVKARGSDYFASDLAPIACDGVTTMWPLGATFYDLVSVRLDLGGGQQVPLDKFTEIEEAMLLSLPSSSGLIVPKYRIRGSSVEVIPAASSGKNILVKFIPAAVRLVAPSDTFDGYNGWEEFVILDAARKVATKDRGWELVSSLRADIAKIEMRIAALAPRRDRGRPDRAQDTRAARRWSRFTRWRLG